MRQAKRVLSLLLAGLLLAFSVSCSDNPAQTGTSNDTTGGQDTAETTASAEELLNDNLPAKDFDGYEFRFYTRNCCESHAEGLYIPELTGDVINDAVYTRNQAVEERFNVKIVEPLTAPDGAATALINSITAQDDVADVAVWHFRHLGDLALQGMLYDLGTIPNLDFEKPWWSYDIIENYTIFNKSYVGLGYLDIDNITYTGCMYFNKKIAEDYAVEDLYSLVSAGKWTLDKLLALTASVGMDLNGDSKMTIDQDLFGFGTAAGLMFMFQSAADQPTTIRESDGTPVLAINTDKMVSIVEKTYALLHENEYAYVSEGGGFDSFRKGTVFIHTGLLNDATMPEMRDMEDDFGIIPFPKYDEAQQNYYSHGSAHGELFGIPITVTDTERTGIILEALLSEGYKTIRPAVYEVALKSKLTRDEESAAMIDIILSGRTGDFADIYDEWGFVYTLDHMVGRATNKDFASYYAANEAASLARISKAVETFAKMN